MDGHSRPDMVFESDAGLSKRLNEEGKEGNGMKTFRTYTILLSREVVDDLHKRGGLRPHCRRHILEGLRKVVFLTFWMRHRGRIAKNSTF